MVWEILNVLPIAGGLTNFNSSLDGLGAFDISQTNVNTQKFQFQFGWFGSFLAVETLSTSFPISIPVWMVWEPAGLPAAAALTAIFQFQFGWFGSFLALRLQLGFGLFQFQFGWFGRLESVF